MTDWTDVGNWTDRDLIRLRVMISDPIIAVSSRLSDRAEVWAGFEPLDPRLDVADPNDWPWRSRTLLRFSSWLHDVGVRRVHRRFP